MSASYDAIVIGSGIGGLGAAAILAREGMRVLVLERHAVAGGLTHTFRRKGYEWDVGLHYLGKVHDPRDPIRGAFDYVTDGRLGWARLDDTYDRLRFPDGCYDFVSGQEACQAALLAAFPREGGALRRYLALAHRVARGARLFFLARALPPALRRLLAPFTWWAFGRFAQARTAEVLARLSADPRLRSVLAGRYGNDGLPPARSSFAMHALVFEYYLDGACYPRGGAGRISQSILPVIERAGGAVRVRAEVQRILVEKGAAVGVRLATGEEIRARRVISNAGYLRTVHELLATRPARDDARERAELSPAHVALYLGLRGDASRLGLLPRNLWIHAGYDHDSRFAEYFERPERPFPFVYVSSPSAKDPEWTQRFPGRSTLVAIAPASYAWFRPWAATGWHRRGTAYETLKQRLTERLLRVVEAELPAVAGRVEHAELSTPLTTEHFTHHPEGAGYGLAHSPARFRHAGLTPSGHGVRDLYLVGQDALTLGVGASLLSAVVATSLILRRNMLRRVGRRGRP